ncbi:MAG: VWA domain-containing protein [Chloroflexi bacterium]|nr:VWA domain-containing protein [Chloroflexota bacterium]
MTFTNPLALALFALAIPVVLLYMLKLRREQRVVSSTLLWRRAVDDVQANVPWQRLRPSVLLLLQLLALAVLVLSLARPALTQARSYAGDLIVIVDESYGMQARDVVPSRFGVALARAHALAGDLAGGSVMSVIGMGDQPQLAIAESDDQGAINGAIDTLRGGVAAPNFLRALSLAASLGRSGAETRVVVLTSRQSGIAGLPIDVPFPVEVVRIGGRLHDLGITAFQATRAGGRTEALLRVSNFGASSASSDLDLTVDGRLADVRPLSVAPGREQTLFWTSLPGGANVLQAHLTRSDDVGEDKTAWAVISTPAIRRVLFVSSGDYFLQTALQVDPSVALSSVSPGSYRPPRAGDDDLVVFDGFLPKALPPAPVWLINPSPGAAGAFRFGARGPAGGLTPADAAGSGSASSLLRYVDLGDVHVAWVRAMRLPDWVDPVAVSQGQTAVAAGDSGSTRLVLFGFDLQQSDWPLRLSFPVIIQNVLDYLAPGLDLGTTSLTAGQPLKLFPGLGARAVEVVRPDGRTASLTPPLPPYTDTSQTGVYAVRVVRGGTQGVPGPVVALLAVNFFPARTAPAPGPDVQWLGRAQGAGAVHKRSVPVSLSWTLYLAALLVLTVEWWFAFRR